MGHFNPYSQWVKMTHCVLRRLNPPLLRGASPVNGSKNRYFFHHYSIAYAFRNTHVKFQAGIRKIVEVTNFYVTSCSTCCFLN